MKVEVVKQDGRMQFVPLPEANSRFPPISCCWRWGSSVPKRSALLDGLGVKLTDRGNVGRDASG